MSPALSVESGRLGSAGITHYEGRSFSGLVECSHEEAHRSKHVAHPVTRRLVCLICHPPGLTQKDDGYYR